MGLRGRREPGSDQLYKFSETLTEGGREGTIEEKFEVKDGKIVTANGDTFALIERNPIP